MSAGSGRHRRAAGTRAGVIVFLCTGNATRSVIAGAALAVERPDLAVATGGTLAVDGLPISWRTRAALDDVGLDATGHRSRQADRDLLDAADLVVGLAPEHVHWVRREHASAAARAATLVRLARDLPGAGRSLAGRLAGLDLAAADLGAWEEVVDPGGGEVDDFVACARRVVGLVGEVAARL